MFRHLKSIRFAGIVFLFLIAVQAWGDETADDAAHTISGIVAELRSGTADVPVCLFDGTTGLPLAKSTYTPIDWDQRPGAGTPDEMAIAVTDAKGRFSFENVPEGNYRLVAQKWVGPYKGVFEVHGTVIQLMGVADGVIVPRPADRNEARIALRPLGDGVVQFDQDVGNSGTFMFLSTSPPEFDPILGLRAPGTSFWQSLIGMNRMPLGKTTVIGVPHEPLYAFFFAADNSPGFATLATPAPGADLVRIGPTPFVASWSNGQKTPPVELANLMQFMDQHNLTSQELLNLPKMSSATHEAYRARLEELMQDLSRTIELPEDQSASVGDLLAIDRYRRLMK